MERRLTNVLNGGEEIDQCFKWWKRGLTNVLSDEIEVLPMFYVVGEGIDQCFKWWERGLTNVLNGGKGD